ncbi:MAG: IreB family regulatory phosphoprotein [Firmicutes bacterium]|nr:IreB family regulatory phosphoprotein [Bacillota bacterium]
MHEAHDRTTLYRRGYLANRAARIVAEVYEALEEKGYDPVAQFVGYLMSGDPTYITSHRDARTLVRTVERDELLSELVRGYIQAQRAVDRTG